MDTTAVKTLDVTKIYHQGKQNEVIPVKKVSLEIENGSVSVLKGPSGSGKTTLLSMIGCQVKPSSGEIIIKGNRISKLPEKFANLYKREHIGFIFQHFNLIPDLSVFDNIMLPLLPAGITLKERKIRADKLLNQFDLEKRKFFKTKLLSGGEQQRVAISRALINGCTILLADEPTAHLDGKLTADFLSYVKLLKESDYTIIIASHDSSIVQNPVVDEVIEMKNGEVAT
jgi:putative ABC transport system ATP-binding protein